MKFAILGIDPESLELAEAAQAAGHELTCQGDLSARETLPHQWLAKYDLESQWETLLESTAIDALIVGRGARDSDSRCQQVQQLLRHGHSLLVTFPLFPSVLSYHEVQLAHADAHGCLMHYNPLTPGPLVELLSHWIETSHPDYGRVEQVLCERFLADRSQPNVLHCFARDVELLDKIAGPFDRVGAHGANAADLSDSAYSTLSVQLSGDGAVPARWMVLPQSGSAVMRLSLICSDGRATADFDQHDRLVRLEAGGRHESNIADRRGESPAARCISTFCEAIRASEASTSETTTTWGSALHAMELADSIEISLRRGRMIDIHSQQLTEQLAFRGTMSAVGCGVLMVLIPCLMVAGWVAEKLGIPVAGYWPHVLLAVLGLFLAVQTLPKLLLPQPDSADASRDDNGQSKTQAGR